MATGVLGNLKIGISVATSEVAAGFAKVSTAMRGFVGQVAGLAGLAGGAGILLESFKLASEIESTQVALEVMTGSADKALKVFLELQKFADVTPFETNDVVTSGKQLIAFGIQADDVVSTLRMLGDVGSLLNVPLSEMAFLFGSARVQGRLFAADIRQFQSRGIPIIQALAKVFNVAESEVSSMVSAGKVGAAELTQAFQIMTSTGGQFADGMAKQATTLGGVWSTFVGNLKTILGEFGTVLVNKLDVKSIVSSMTSYLSDVRDIANILGEVIGNVAKAIRWFGAVVQHTWKWVTALIAVHQAVRLMNAALLIGIELNVAMKYGVWVAELSAFANVLRAAVVPAIVNVVRGLAAWITAQLEVLVLSGPKGWAIIAAGVAVFSLSIGVATDKLIDYTMAAEEADVVTSVAAKNFKNLSKAVGDVLVADMQFAARHAADMASTMETLKQRAHDVAVEFVQSDAAGTFTAKVAELDAMLSTGMVTIDIYNHAISGLVTAYQAADPVFQKAQRDAEDLAEANATLAKRIEETRAATISDMQSRAADIVNATRTPLEQFASKVQEVRDLLALGFIDQDTASRSIANISTDMDEFIDREGMKYQNTFTPPQSIGAAQRGSAEAASLITKALQGDKQLALMEKQLAEQKAATKELRQAKEAILSKKSVTVGI